MACDACEKRVELIERYTMRFLIAILFLTACGESVRVLDNDASTIVTSDNEHWVKCVSDRCPNGYIIIDTSNSTTTYYTIKCK